MKSIHHSVLLFTTVPFPAVMSKCLLWKSHKTRSSFFKHFHNSLFVIFLINSTIFFDLRIIWIALFWWQLFVYFDVLAGFFKASLNLKCSYLLHSIPCDFWPASNTVDSLRSRSWFSNALCWSKTEPHTAQSVVQAETSAECWSRIRSPSATLSLIITQPDGELIVDQWLWWVSYEPPGLSSMTEKESSNVLLKLLIKTWFTTVKLLSGLFSQSMALIIQLKLRGEAGTS